MRRNYRREAEARGWRSNPQGRLRNPPWMAVLHDVWDKLKDREKAEFLVEIDAWKQPAELAVNLRSTTGDPEQQAEAESAERSQ
jgi:hypothetical protein